MAEGSVVPLPDYVAWAEEAKLLAAGRQIEDKLGERRLAEVSVLIAVTVADDPERTVVVGAPEDDGAGARLAVEVDRCEGGDLRAVGVLGIKRVAEDGEPG